MICKAESRQVMCPREDWYADLCAFCYDEGSKAYNNTDTHQFALGHPSR